MDEVSFALFIICFMMYPAVNLLLSFRCKMNASVGMPIVVMSLLQFITWVPPNFWFHLSNFVFEISLLVVFYMFRLDKPKSWRNDVYVYLFMNYI